MQDLGQLELERSADDPSSPFRVFDWPMHHIMMTFIQHMENLNHALKNQGIDQRIWRVLTQISELGTPTVQGLATAGGFDRSTLSKILIQVEALGLVDRKPDVRDRRRINLTLTDEGRRKIEQCAPHAVNLLETYLADFKPEERELLMKLIRRLRANVEVEGALAGRRVERISNA